MNIRNKIEYLVGNEYIKREASIPYNEKVCNFIGELSNELRYNFVKSNLNDELDISETKVMLTLFEGRVVHGNISEF